VERRTYCSNACYVQVEIYSLFFYIFYCKLKLPTESVGGMILKISHYDAKDKYVVTPNI